MHVLPQLRRLEELFPDELAVVGVHAGKFTAERVTANIRQAVLRLEVHHPVVNDRYFRVWRAYGVQAWPTVALIDPDGNYVGSQPGEITAEAFEPIIGRMAQQFRALGRLATSPLPCRLEAASEPARPLAFPGKVHASGDGRLFIADTNHNRVLVVSLSPDRTAGRVEQIVGSGRAALADGDFAAASFNHPQGLYLVGDTLYVADAENHAIRAVDLARRRVQTIAGTGRQARRLGLLGRGEAVALNSPWDLLLRDGRLYIAMAGEHQLWALDLATGEVRPYVGSGREDLVDGGPRQAALAQPTGLAGNGSRLFFADSEASATRYVDLAAGGQVRTVVGRGLFDFGDVDGVGEEVRLQHAYGLAWQEGALYVADTYNEKIKVVDPATRAARTLLGTGAAGFADGDVPQFWEPEGLAVADGRLYVADTNNHAIRVADLRGGRVTTLALAGL